MPQDRESGARARRWGYENAQKVAKHLGATIINRVKSNEAIWNNRKILITSAHCGTPNISATIATLGRIEAIVAAVQETDGRFTLCEIKP